MPGVEYVVESSRITQKRKTLLTGFLIEITLILTQFILFL
jgi:hypothetical protein